MLLLMQLGYGRLHCPQARPMLARDARTTRADIGESMAVGGNFPPVNTPCCPRNGGEGRQGVPRALTALGQCCADPPPRFEARRSSAGLIVAPHLSAELHGALRDSGKLRKTLPRGSARLRMAPRDSARLREGKPGSLRVSQALRRSATLREGASNDEGGRGRDRLIGSGACRERRQRLGVGRPARLDAHTGTAVHGHFGAGACLVPCEVTRRASRIYTCCLVDAVSQHCTTSLLLLELQLDAWRACLINIQSRSFGPELPPRAAGPPCAYRVILSLARRFYPFHPVACPEKPVDRPTTGLVFSCCAASAPRTMSCA